MSETLDRYSRQVLFRPIGEPGQRKIRSGSAVVVGVGALGGSIANFMVRAGIGKILLIDHDKVQIDNLQRQMLFDEDDARDQRPKVVAAEKKLKIINSEVEIQTLFGELNSENAEALLSGVNVVLDGLDNFETRFIVNRTCVKLGIPYIHGAVAGSSATTMNILPGLGPCLRCLWPEDPAPEQTDNCRTLGILGGLPALLGAIIAAEAVKILIGHSEIDTDLHCLDLWSREWSRIAIQKNPGCNVCGK